jgi:hypothetical protein
MMVFQAKFTILTRWLGCGCLALLIVVATLFSSTTGLYAQTQSGIASPADGSTISGDTPIIGTAVIDQFQKYELHFKLDPSGDDAYVYFAGGTSQVSNGQLGVWAAAGLPPGSYSLRLRVVKADGNYAEFFIHNIRLNQGAVATPTSSTPTETPIPTFTFTPAPQPTAAVGDVQQPSVEGDQATPAPLLATPTPDSAAGASGVTTAVNTPPAGGGVNAPAAEAEGSSLTRDLGAALSFEKLREQFWNGVRYGALLFLLIGLIFGGKRLLGWAWLRFR